jgi:FAD/FMN-containing dehydrogenase
MVVRHAPPLPFLPEEVHGQLVVAVPFLHVGDREEGERWARPIRDFKTPLGEHVGMSRYAAWQATFDSLNEKGAGNYWKSHYLRDLDDGLIDTVTEFAHHMPCRSCELLLPHLGGAIEKVPSDVTAFAHRDAPFLLNIHSRWVEEGQEEAHVTWARELFDAARPSSTGGVYVNFLSEEGKQRVRDAYPEAKWGRLVEIKRRYDPENLFRLNQNIPPEG